uniref:Uncharacterized protein LOC108051963 n=1 Tax=Drosophila rhopaloa TaxID=1041015 RepID=A0A6P4FH78_DRORH
MEQLQPGDACLECLGLGKNHKLRFFNINLEEQLLKCESRSCLWPHNDEVSSDEELDLGAGVPFSDPLSAIRVVETPGPTLPPPSGAISLANPPSDDDDEFILQLLQQLTPSTDTNSVESFTESNMNLSSMADLFSLNHTEEKSCPELELPDLSFLEENITGLKEPPKAVIAKQEITLLPAKLRSPPKSKIPQSYKVKVEVAPLKTPSSQVKQDVVPLNTCSSQTKQEVAPLKIFTGSTFQRKLEIPLLPASLNSSPRIKPKGDPFSTPPKKASTQPQTQLQTSPAVNIIISIPELNPAIPFLDAIKRHSAEAKHTARAGGRRPRRLTRETPGRGIRTQELRNLIEQLETTADAKRSAPPP